MDPFTMIAVAILLLVASYAITASMAPKDQGKKPNVIADFEFAQFEEGTPQCVVFGDCWTPDWMVLATTNFKVKPIYGGKKGKK